MKKVFSILMVAFAMTAMVACGEKDDPQPTPGYPANNKRNVEIKINGADGLAGVVDALNSTTLTPLCEDNTVDTILIKPYGNWSWLRGSNQEDIITVLKIVCSKYPKTWGRGDFNFYPGDLSESDSLWFVQNGWTINQR